MGKTKSFTVSSFILSLNLFSKVITQSTTHLINQSQTTMLTPQLNKQRRQKTMIQLSKIIALASILFVGTIGSLLFAKSMQTNNERNLQAASQQEIEQKLMEWIRQEHFDTLTFDLKQGKLSGSNKKEKRGPAKECDIQFHIDGNEEEFKRWFGAFI